MDSFFPGVEVPTVLNQETMSEPSPDDADSEADGSGGSSGPPGSPSITSRLSLLKLGAVISKFSHFKQKLVRETGFGGMLEIKSWQKVNLKYSAYLMDRVDVDNRIINLEGQGMLELSEKQVHYVFGIPSGEQAISPEGVDPSESCIEYSRAAASFCEKGTHSLKAAEDYLLRDITADSRKIEIDCFKIAFVIFVVGHVLAPSAKHDYITIDFWAALNDASKINTWDWCGYLLKHLFQAVRKFKADVMKRNHTIHIVGCHLFLQVFVLDSLELGLLNRAPGLHPRIALFDYDSMKKMVETITVNLGGGEFSYHGASVRPEQNVSKTLVCASTESPNHFACKTTPKGKRPQMPNAPLLRASYAKIGPQDFANHIRVNYPKIAGEKIGILLKEHNARGLASISEMRQSFQSLMFSFADKIVNCITENCTCCKALGRKECIMKIGEQKNMDTPTPIATSAREDVFETPVNNKLTTRLNSVFELDGGSASGNNFISRKRDCGSSTSIASDSSKKICTRLDEPIQMQPPSALDTMNNSSLSAKEEARREISTIVYNFFDDLTASIVTYYAELRPSAEYVLFGSTNDTVPTKIRLKKCSIARDPWSIGSVPLPPSPTVLRAIKDWFEDASTLRLERKWILHPCPRLLSLDGLEIEQQLSGRDPLSHEMCATIFRRLGQMDKLFSKDSVGMLWRKFMEPDFSTTVLSNADPLTIQSIRLSFTEGTDKWNPASIRMWHVPALLPDGWVLYTWDMIKRSIAVLDPAVGPFGFSNRRINMHTYVSDLLHNALFRCFQFLFESWHCSCGEWKRDFPLAMVEKIDKEDYGICTTFFARNFDGEKLHMPVTKINLQMHKNLMLYEVMRLQGNESLIPSDAIEAIKGSFVAL